MVIFKIGKKLKTHVQLSFPASTVFPLKKAALTSNSEAMVWEGNASYLSSNLYGPLKKENGTHPVGYMTFQYSQHESSKKLTEILLEIKSTMVWPKYIHETRESNSSLLNR